MGKTIFDKIKAPYNKLYKKFIAMSNSKRKIEYLRRLGVKIGKNCRIDTINFSTEPYLVSVGNHVAISSGTLFITHDGAVRCFKPGLSGGIFGKISVGDNTFIGMNCIITLNTKIGKNCIVGVGSVVRGNIPDNSVVMGNPAKIVSKMNVVKFFYENSPGLIQTDGLTTEKKDKLVKQVLCKEK